MRYLTSWSVWLLRRFWHSIFNRGLKCSPFGYVFLTWCLEKSEMRLLGQSVENAIYGSTFFRRNYGTKMLSLYIHSCRSGSNCNGYMVCPVLGIEIIVPCHSSDLTLKCHFFVSLHVLWGLKPFLAFSLEHQACIVMFLFFLNSCFGSNHAPSACKSGQLILVSIVQSSVPYKKLCSEEKEHVSNYSAEICLRSKKKRVRVDFFKKLLL